MTVPEQLENMKTSKIIQSIWTYLFGLLIFLGEYFYLESYITCLVALVIKLKIIKQIQKYLI